MLSLDQVVGVGTASAMTVAVGDRFAVLVCENAELLRAAHVELTPASSAVGTATLSLASINSVFGARGIALPASYRFALEATATEWILHGSPGAAGP